MSYMQEYEKWLASPALSEQEHAELESIRDDEKEIRERFYGPLEFGTAGLRGTMKVGLHQMNIHVIRWATQGFANVICAEGEEAKGRGVALCMDCRDVQSHAEAGEAVDDLSGASLLVVVFETWDPVSRQQGDGHVCVGRGIEGVGKQDCLLPLTVFVSGPSGDIGGDTPVTQFHG